jgi:hypothetical protein
VTGKWQWDRKSKNEKKREERKLMNEKNQLTRRRGIE